MSKVFDFLHKIEKVADEFLEKHGQHNQQSHGRGGGSSNDDESSGQAARSAAAEKSGFTKNGKLTSKGVKELVKKMKKRNSKMTEKQLMTILKRSGLLAKDKTADDDEIAEEHLKIARELVDEFGIDPELIK